MLQNTGRNLQVKALVIIFSFFPPFLKLINYDYHVNLLIFLSKTLTNENHAFCFIKVVILQLVEIDAT